MSNTLTVAVLVRNTKGFGRFLSTLGFADQIIFISDEPIESKSNWPAKVKLYHRKLNRDFSAQRNFALSQCQTDWIMFLDDDEVVNPALVREIKATLNHPTAPGYYLKRLDRYFNHIVSHGESGAVRLMRLGRPSAGRWHRPVHEVWQIPGRCPTLSTPLYHQHNEFVSYFFKRWPVYGPLDAISLNKEGKGFSYFRVLANPFAKFVLNYFYRLGLLDGSLGIFHAYLMAVQSLTNRIYQWERLN